MLVLMVILALSAGSALADPVRRSSHIFQRQEAAPRGFLPPGATAPSRNTSANSSDYYALTRDGRLEKIQVVYPQGSQVQQNQAQDNTEDFLLTPDGRLEKLQEEPVEKTDFIEYFRLTEDGRLQHIKAEDIPTDAKEESGEYHVLLPSGTLQRVRFMSTVRDNLVSAKVQYQEVPPLQGPVYQYAAPLVRIV